MSVKSEPYYWLECDGCGARSTAGGEYSAWSDVCGALEEAECLDWVEVGGAHYCDGCAPGEAVVLWCPHLSWSGAEGPVAELGRWPVLWSCDGCGRLEVRR